MVSEVKKLAEAADVLRRDSLVMTSKAGSGHPTTCMSCAEIMACLFFDEMKYDVKDAGNVDNDEFVLSKGHAAPIYYSCLKHAGAIDYDLKRLREFDSPLEGHPMPNSLKWAKVGTGSLGQGLSVGCGMALAGKFDKRGFRTYVLMGDSELAEGSVYEALGFAEYYKLNNLTAIVDVNRLGQSGETMHGHDIERYEKIFSGFGWHVLSVDGHDVKELLRAFGKAREVEKPSVILAKTFKGKGVSFLENKEGWHGKALDDEKLAVVLKELSGEVFPEFEIDKPKTVVRKKKFESLKLNMYNREDGLIASREAYGKALANLALNDDRILAIDAETGNSTFSDKVKEKSAGQFIQCFIAEQNMIGVASGLHVKGFKVFPSTFAAFLTRAYDQIRMANVSGTGMTVCGSHAGVSIGADGASQMGLEDIGMFRSLLNSHVFYPSDAVSCDRIVNACSRLKGINYIRTTREKTPVLYGNEEKFPVGEFKALRKSEKDEVVLVGCGITLHECLKAHDLLLDKGVKSAVVDLYCVKPFDHSSFIEFVRKHGSKVVVVEDHHYEGGVGEMLKSGLVGSEIEVKHLAVGKLPHSGMAEELLRDMGIDGEGIVNSVRGMVG
ncbi:transketolase [Candidatus Pacearchaeota archaeon]|jgi:transketolase|nr:transketolase [Candidatus Pacearchaeota archaeon]|tara:strand:- start:6969 stop:8798 length:1830 start_codon:yes stop_codon:yes gene_type:complete